VKTFDAILAAFTPLLVDIAPIRPPPPELVSPPPAGPKAALGTKWLDGTETEEIISGRVVVSGTYLPFHFMVVRWWPEVKETKAS
jgi:hypothetical protein